MLSEPGSASVAKHVVILDDDKSEATVTAIQHTLLPHFEVVGIQAIEPGVSPNLAEVAAPSLSPELHIEGATFGIEILTREPPVWHQRRSEEPLPLLRSVTYQECRKMAPLDKANGGRGAADAELICDIINGGKVRLSIAPSYFVEEVTGHQQVGGKLVGDPLDIVLSKCFLQADIVVGTE